MSQFIIHRGLIISVIQSIFSICFYFVAIPVYNGLLMLGYATIYTNLPVFSLVLDEDVPVQAVMKFPPLYKTLQLGRSLSTKTFLIWVWKSIFQVPFFFFNIFQGCVIMLSTLFFFKESFSNIVTITFTALVITELLNVYSEVLILFLKIINIDKQTKLENDHCRFRHILVLHTEHCTFKNIFRYIIYNVAIHYESIGDNSTFMVTTARH